jgi:lycopene cyclase-like protein
LYTSTQASEKGLKVALIDPKPLAGWRNNYGVWCDEFQALGFEDCYRASWPRAQVIFGDADTPEENDRQTGKFLDRAYAQVDRAKLKSKLIYRAMENKVEFGTQNVKSVKHEEDDVSEVTLSDGSVVFAKMVLDATGHARKLVDFEREFTPGYQAAFGIVCDVESHPFPLDTMLFMDWRDDHLDDAYKSVNDILPTFLYAMPFSKWSSRQSINNIVSNGNGCDSTSQTMPNAAWYPGVNSRSKSTNFLACPVASKTIFANTTDPSDNVTSETSSSSCLTDFTFCVPNSTLFSIAL